MVVVDVKEDDFLSDAGIGSEVQVLRSLSAMPDRFAFSDAYQAIFPS